VPETGPPVSRSVNQGSRVRAPRDLVAGLGLLALAALALWAGAPLEQGTLRAMGPGMLPRALGVLIALSGAALVSSAFVRSGPRLEPGRARGPIFVSLAVVVFALTIRSLGLAVAGPLVVLLGGAAAGDVRYRELLPLAIFLTLLCIGLFRYALGLPIPVLNVPGLVTL